VPPAPFISGLFPLAVRRQFWYDEVKPFSRKVVAWMGVKFYREYRDIVDDLSQALLTINDCYLAFYMNPDDWQELDSEERSECVRTLADDVFYGLGKEPRMKVGSGQVLYDQTHHLIKVYPNAQIVHLVKLN
jgi:hypothetical protein